MSSDANPAARPSGLGDHPPARRRRRRAPWVVLALLVLVPAALWVAGVVPTPAWSQSGTALRTVAVDRGDLAIVVVESGELESANNTTVKCKVEALIGQVGGAAGAAGMSGGGGAGGAPGGLTSAGATGGGMGAAGGAQGKAATQAGAAQAKTGASGGVPATGGAGGGGATSAGQRPNIRSFQMQVAKHVPLRPQAAARTQTKGAAGAPGGFGGGPGGGGGGGGRGGGGGSSSSSSEMMERPGSTRVISILPEGTRVRAGDVVCELDSAAFRDELAAQAIRYEQAKAWVEQAKTILEVSEIDLREYNEGIYPQDRELINQYIKTCETELKRAREAYDWAVEAEKKSVRTASQVEVDRLTFERATIALSDAKGMWERLEKYTAPRLIKSLQAKIDAVRADLLTQQAAFHLEDERRRRLQAMVGYCTLRAPREGIVVYAKQSSGWGRVEDQIREGVTVREGQAIFHLPDPNRMRVRVRVNESKVAQVKPGLRATIRVDAFPDRPLAGTVTEVTPIPAPATGPISDIKVYFAIVAIDTGGFEGLRPGLSAEVTFLVGNRPAATRVPIQAIRWAGSRAFAARTTSDGPRWQPVTLGVLSAGSAEVLSGLEPGDRVIADPTPLGPPPG